MLIGCLHTAATNVPGLDAAAAAVEGVELQHVVRPDLLAAALAAGQMTEDTRAEAEAELLALASECDAVLLTCSSIGLAVEGVQDEAVPVIRVDGALAERAVAGGGRVAVLYGAIDGGADRSVVRGCRGQDRGGYRYAHRAAGLGSVHRR